MRVLVTGFEPFMGSAVNPSQQVVERLQAAPPPGADFAFAVLPTVYYAASARLRELLDSVQPDLWVGLGQGGGAGLHVEQVGINLNHVRPGRADNAGNSPQDEIAAPESPDARFATLPVRALAEYLRGQGIPAQVSYHAGTFICNHVLFAGLDHAASRGLPLLGGFIHTPLLPEQAAALEGDLRPSMALDYLEYAIRTALGWLVTPTRTEGGPVALRKA
jgi:pyroglutamyl-peptidase